MGSGDNGLLHMTPMVSVSFSSLSLSSASVLVGWIEPKMTSQLLK